MVCTSSLAIFSFSNEPYKTSSIASFGISLTGVLRLQSYRFKSASICQKIIWFLYFPNGTIAPLWMSSLSSGITFFRSISSITPKPLHCGQAPSGELKEKMFGAGSLYAIPVTGSISRLEKYLASSRSLSRIIIKPSPCFMAVETVFARRSRSVSFSVPPSFILSMTTSMLWFL